jgi:ribulose-5-phosphate 4-epimerase/fuculose-1-phosphate aldolase
MSVTSDRRAAERAARVDLAACVRLCQHHGWVDMIYTHLSARIVGTDSYVINPMGALFDEITASSLVKIGPHDPQAPGSVNKAGLLIHSWIMEARPDVNFIIHLHTDYGTAVSIQARGLLPISQKSATPVSSIGYHDYEGIVLRDDERKRFLADLGDRRVMLLRNHGTLVVGRTAEEAFLLTYALERACKIQILAQSSGQDLVHLTPQALENAVTGARSFHAALQQRPETAPWNALLRLLDRTCPEFRD